MTDRDQHTIHKRWALWNLRALHPHATTANLSALELRRQEFTNLEQRILAYGEGDHVRLRDDARAFLAAHPEITSGLVITLHMGPYVLLPVVYLGAGVEPVIVLDRAAHDRIRPDAERQQRKLGLSGHIQWITTDRPLFAGRILRALRAGRPVLVFLDGNSGNGGMEATRDRGMPYRLPGRTIRVRTGLGRLIQRTGCSVHAVSVRWRADGTLAWRGVSPGKWDKTASPRQVTRQLYDWLFDEVARSPEQWSFWPMIARTSECFSTIGMDGGAERHDRGRRSQRFENALRDHPSGTRVRLEGEVEVWEPDVLADLTRQRFWAAEGLRDSALDLFRYGAEPTLTELEACCGRDWIDFHVRRLHLLGVLELREPS
jgi:hypothetical protein